MLPLSLNITVMLIGYLLVMGYLALGLRTLRRHPDESWQPPRQLAPDAMRRGWPGLIRQVVGTAVGGYVLLMAVTIGYYRGVARAGPQFLASAFTGAATLIGITLPLFFVASWMVVAMRRRSGGTAGR